jgi:predicted phage-related endonuclease
MKWNDDKTITITPPAKPKKITGTRFAAIMGLNKWTSPFNAWCAITRTYEEPFEDTIYTIAGKTIEPKQAEYMKTAYFMSNLITPTDVYGEDYFKKTWGDFFRDTPIFGGMWDYLLVDKEGKPQTVLEMKTTKRSEDWVEDVPEYYALQAALYAYLLGVDDVIMVCSVLGEKDYDDPAAYECKAENTFVRPFKVSERYPNMKKTITQVKKWWKTHVEGGVSPKYDEKADADILKVLRDNNLSPDSDLDAMVKEAEGLMLHIEEVNATVADDEKRLKKLKELIKEASMSQFKPGDKTVTITGGNYDFVTTVSMKKKQDFDTEAMEKDGVLDKYMTETEKPEYRFTPKKRKESA